VSRVNLRISIRIVRFHYELLAKYGSSESVDFDANELAAGMNPKRMRDKLLASR
jgi:hypothetical protein